MIKTNIKHKDFDFEQYYTNCMKREINTDRQWKLDPERLKKWMDDNGYRTRPLGSWI